MQSFSVSAREALIKTNTIFDPRINKFSVDLNLQKKHVIINISD